MTYLLSNGTDESTCGKNESTACKILDHVLSLFYNTTDPPKLRLEIIMSNSLIIDQHLMVSRSNFSVFINSLPMPTDAGGRIRSCFVLQLFLMF